MQSVANVRLGMIVKFFFVLLFLYRLLHHNEISLHRQRSVCEMDLEELKLKHEASQFGRFLKANPVEEWAVCSLPNLYFKDL